MECTADGDQYCQQLCAVQLLSTFSGTHYVTPRALTAELGFHFERFHKKGDDGRITGRLRSRLHPSLCSQRFQRRAIADNQRRSIQPDQFLFLQFAEHRVTVSAMNRSFAPSPHESSSNEHEFQEVRTVGEWASMKAGAAPTCRLTNAPA